MNAVQTKHFSFGIKCNHPSVKEAFTCGGMLLGGKMEFGLTLLLKNGQRADFVSNKNFGYMKEAEEFLEKLKEE